MENDKNRFKYMFCLASLVAIINVMFCTNQAVGTIITIIEGLILLYLALQRKIAVFISFFVIFVSNCMEFSQFVGNNSLYNIKSIRLGGVNIAAWMLLILLMSIFTSPFKISETKDKQPLFHKYGKNMVLVNVMATIVGFIGLLFNDNGIRTVPGYMSSYFGVIYSSLFIPITIFCGLVYVTSYEKGKLSFIYSALQATLLASAVQICFSFIFGYYGRYGGVDTLLTSTLYFLLPLLLLVSDDSIVFKPFTIIITVAGTILTLFFNTNGKEILTVAIVIAFLIGRLLKDKKLSSKVLAICIVGGIFIVIPVALSYLVQNSIIFRSKYVQSIGMMNVFDKNWLINLPGSPRARVEELRDVAIELVGKPWFLFTGKGYLGSIIDHTNYFSTLTSNVGLFSDIEWTHGIYYNLHELSSNILMFGFIGIVYSASLIKTIRQKKINNGWIIVGAYWFLLLFGYSFTLCTFGTTAYLIGLMDRNLIDE